MAYAFTMSDVSIMGTEAADVRSRLWPAMDSAHAFVVSYLGASIRLDFVARGR